MPKGNPNSPWELALREYLLDAGLEGRAQSDCCRWVNQRYAVKANEVLIQLEAWREDRKVDRYVARITINSRPRVIWRATTEMLNVEPEPEL